MSRGARKPRGEKKERLPVSFRLQAAIVAELGEMSQRSGLSKTAIVELALQYLFRDGSELFTSYEKLQKRLVPPIGEKLSSKPAAFRSKEL